MNTITTHLTRITTMTALAAAGFMVLPAHAATHEVRTIQLPTVTITAKRIQVIQLDRVVITAKRITPASTMLAQRNQRIAPRV